MNRRSFLAGCTLSATIAGCFSRSTQECDIESGRWQGEGEPISTKAELNQEENSEQFDTDREIERECAMVAAEAAFGELNDRLDTDIEEKSWASYGSRYSNGEDGAWVEFAYTRNRDGSVSNCPDPEFEVATARASLPAEVTVTLELSEPNEPYECTHEIQLRTGGHQLD